MPKLSDYEQHVRSEIIKWRDEKDSVLTKVLNTVGMPVEWVYEHVVPDSISNTLNKAVLGFIEMLRDASKWTYPDQGIIRAAAKVGIEIDNYRDLSEYNLEQLDQIARTFINENKILAALEGAGCGLVGLAMIAADVPMLFMISFRAVQQIGSSYGFDMKDPDMFPIILSVFNAGSSASTTAKAYALADMRVAAIAYSKNWTYKKTAQRTGTGVIAQLLKERTKHLPKDIANNVTKRKLSQAIPIVGSAIGAGFNYWFMSNTTRGAYMLFRELFLLREYGNEAESQPDISAFDYLPSQCNGSTRQGKRCMRITKDVSGLCYQHR